MKLKALFLVALGLIWLAAASPAPAEQPEIGFRINLTVYVLDTQGQPVPSGKVVITNLDTGRVLEKKLTNGLAEFWFKCFDAQYETYHHRATAITKLGKVDKEFITEARLCTKHRNFVIQYGVAPDPKPAKKKNKK